MTTYRLMLVSDDERIIEIVQSLEGYEVTVSREEITPDTHEEANTFDLWIMDTRLVAWIPEHDKDEWLLYIVDDMDDDRWNKGYVIPRSAHHKILEQHIYLLIGYQRILHANKSKSEFMGFVARELKNPLASVKGYADVLASGMIGELTEQQQKFVEIIQQEVHRMRTIIDDLRDPTYLGGGESYRGDPIDAEELKALVVDTQKILEPILREKQQTLSIEMPDRLPIVLGKSAYIAQALTYLLVNAHRYSPNQSPIQLSFISDIDYLYVTIADRGTGIRQEDIEKIFNRDFKTNDTKQPKMKIPKLLLAKSRVEEMGGQIWAESDGIGKGATFHFTVPLYKGDDTP